MKTPFVEDGPSRMPREAPPPPGSPVVAWIAWFIRRFVVGPMDDARKLWLVEGGSGPLRHNADSRGS